ncbi:MAG TPA: hypothetical protein VFU04_04065 [Solirubrobacterales bacterium]|nr:hypothetical protein [Solirubrobacterales bacterium]
MTPRPAPRVAPFALLAFALPGALLDVALRAVDFRDVDFRDVDFFVVDFDLAEVDFFDRVPAFAFFDAFVALPDPAFLAAIASCLLGRLSVRVGAAA